MFKEGPTLTTWSNDALRKIAGTDDLHISPLREDGATYGTPRWIWSCPSRSTTRSMCAPTTGRPSLYRAAMHGGGITAAGATTHGPFEPVDGPINDLVDDAYRAKYHGRPYLTRCSAHGPAPRR
jgi:hypothetical protein